MVLVRTIYEDAEVFARNLHELGYISARDYSTYEETYEVLRDELPPPGMIVYLRASLATLEQRAEKSILQEQGTSLPVHHLERLNNLYDEWAACYELSTLLPISVDGIDFERDLDDYLTVLRLILPVAATLV